MAWVSRFLTGFVHQANILIDQAGHARLADFGLLTIALDATNTPSSNSFIPGGTPRWMSPELFDPEKFDLKDSRQTEYSDCYALGMVVYEVLSGRIPFSRHHDLVVIVAIVKGERPGRPRGEEGMWFTDGVWSAIERCWKADPGDRPTIKDVLQCLEGVSGSWVLPSPQTTINPQSMDSATRNFDPSTEESSDESEPPSPPRSVTHRSSQELPTRGDPNVINIRPPAHEFIALPNGAPDYKDLRAGVTNPGGSDSEECAGILDRVS